MDTKKECAVCHCISQALGSFCNEHVLGLGTTVGTTFLASRTTSKPDVDRVDQGDKHQGKQENVHL